MTRKNSASPSITDPAGVDPGAAHVADQRAQHLGDAAAAGGRVDVPERASCQQLAPAIDRQPEALERFLAAITSSKRSGASVASSTSVRLIARPARMRAARRGSRRRGLGSRPRPASVRKPTVTCAGVAEHAHAHADRAGARRPHEHPGQRRPRDREPVAGAGHVGEHHRRLGGEVIDQPGLDGGRRAAHQLEDRRRRSRPRGRA